MVPWALPTQDGDSGRRLMWSRASATPSPTATEPGATARTVWSEIANPTRGRQASRPTTIVRTALRTPGTARDILDMSTRLDAERHDEQVRIQIELGSSDPLDQLWGLRAADRQLDLWQRQTITRAREQGSSWQHHPGTSTSVRPHSAQ